MDKKARDDVIIREEGDDLVIGNGSVQLGFSKSMCGALVSIRDPGTGYELRRDANAPALLYRLGLLLAEEESVDWYDSSSARDFTFQTVRANDTALLRLSSFIPTLDARVFVTISLRAGSTLTCWRMKVNKPKGESFLHQLICPVITGLVKPGSPEPGESLAVPVQGEGYLFQTPFPVRDRLPIKSGQGPDTADVGVGSIRGRYPGSIAMQMYALYNDRAGVYLATHDAGENVKEFGMGPLTGLGEGPALTVSHFSPARDDVVATGYDTVLGVFHGDWYDAADIYKAWARKQWWCEKKLGERDIPAWMHSAFGVFQMSNYDIPVLKLNHSLDQIAETVNQLSREPGVPLLALIFNWEGAGAWTGPAGFFPPREGEQAFKDAMAKLRDAGNRGFVYMPGGQWYIKIPYDPLFDSWAQFRNEAESHAVKAPSGKTDIHVWTGYGGWESARLCPAEGYTRNLTESVLTGCLERGCDVVQIDNFPCGGSEACYDANHDHPAGLGPWWSEAWHGILAHVRERARRVNPDAAISTEGISENFIPWLDMYDNRAGNMEYFGHYSRGMPMGGETIPLFNYVYNEYIASYCAAYPECNRPEVIYWTRCLGKSLVQGVVPTGGRYFPEPCDHNPVTIRLYKRILQAAAIAWPYIMFGEMLRPPKIDVPSITAPYCKFFFDGTSHCADPTRRHEVTDRAVQHSAWRGQDGSFAYLFVNISEKEVAFAVQIAPPVETGACFHLDEFSDGEHRNTLHNVTPPTCCKLQMPPLSVTLIIANQEGPPSDT